MDCSFEVETSSSMLNINRFSWGAPSETCHFYSLLKFKTPDCTEPHKTKAVAGVRGDFASSCLKIPEGASRTKRSQNIEIQ